MRASGEESDGKYSLHSPIKVLNNRLVFMKSIREVLLNTNRADLNEHLKKTEDMISQYENAIKILESHRE